MTRACPPSCACWSGPRPRNRTWRKSPIAPNAPATFGVKLVGAFAAGVGAALLSGACVAPVLVSTLVMASAMTAGGNPAGATLPLVLGLGLGFPWPFFGGGVATLPRPGRWMNVVKYVFAAVFIAMAARYALTAWRILDPGDARVDGAIADIFAQFPYRAGSVPAPR